MKDKLDGKIMSYLKDKKDKKKAKSTKKYVIKRKLKFGDKHCLLNQLEKKTVDSLR